MHQKLSQRAAGAGDHPGGTARGLEQTNRDNAEQLRSLLTEQADFVFIHDPQPALLLRNCPNRKGKWVWRCHIDLSRPNRGVWKYLREWVAGYDASVWSLADFAQPLPHPLYLIAPSIDPLSQKNRDLYAGEVDAVFDRHGLDPDLPLITQVSRYDRFKDPIGVIRAFQLAREFTPLQLVLAGGGAADDPEGEEVLREVREAAGDDPNIHILLLPADAHREINALQRASTIVLQKSTREGFGLTVTEAMWKGRPVIGGNTGGIRLQVINHQTGFLVNTPEGAALRIRYLLKNREHLEEMGRRGARAGARQLPRHPPPARVPDPDARPAPRRPGPNRAVTVAASLLGPTPPRPGAGQKLLCPVIRRFLRVIFYPKNLFFPCIAQWPAMAHSGRHEQRHRSVPGTGHRPPGRRRR